MRTSEFILYKLKVKQEENSLRTLKIQTDLIDFTSNDYLGLAHSAELFTRIQEKIISLPHLNGATGSRLLSGNNAYTEEVEQKLSTIFKSKSSLIFNSGYTANMAVLSSIPQRGDTIIYDELAHACIKDGVRLSLATRHPFKHNDLADLESKIKKSSGNIFIVVESIYSMDGDACPLEEVTQLAEKYNASIILDEAHSTGVFGDNGCGMSVAKNVHEKIFARIYTFGKAMGVHGACVCGDQSLIDYLINFARPFIYTTALPLHSIVSIDCAFSYLSENLPLQVQLSDTVTYYLNEIQNIETLQRTASNSAIQTIITPGNSQVRRNSEILSNKGFDVRPILSPTVKEGAERLRICLHTYNTKQEITDLVNSLKIISE